MLRCRADRVPINVRRRNGSLLPLTAPKLMVQLGVAGVGQHFTRYRDALRRLRNPVEIGAVYDTVFARAEAVAEEEQAACETGLRALGRRHSLDAVLMLDPGWAGLAGLRSLASCHKPVFVAPWISGSASDFADLHATATSDGGSIMPALWRRFIPASVRVQELIATEAGPPEQITVHQCVPAGTCPGLLIESVTGWLDFCRNVFRALPVTSWIERPSESWSAVGQNADSPTATRWHLEVDFPAATGESSPRSRKSVAGNDQPVRHATIELTAAEPVDLPAELRSGIGRPATETVNGQRRAGAAAPFPTVEIICERGRLLMNSSTEVAIRTADGSLESEQLSSDRSEHEIMLDLFCRRVAGGLAPVPDYIDISHALRMLEQALAPSSGQDTGR